MRTRLSPPHSLLLPLPLGQCIVAGKSLPEAMSIPVPATGGGGASPAAYEARVLACVTSNIADAEGKFEPLTWYPVAVRRTSDGASTTVHRRFKDFAEFDDLTRAALVGNHLHSSLPELPPKSSKFLVDHSDPKFQVVV